MSNQQHTLGPWIVEKAHDIDAIAWVGQFAILPKDHGTNVARGNTEADARRIVACVNACAEIPTDDLEDTKLLPMLDAYGMAIHQRDVLLAALECLLPWAEVIGSVHPDVEYSGDHPIAVSRAAISSTKGGTK